jgi:hypothetical protein
MAFVYPTSQEIMGVEAERLANLQKNRPIFDIMPITTADTPVVRWEQEDNVLGLQGLRGLGGQPSRVRAVGSKTYIVEPGIYGEYRQIDEIELMTRRQFASTGAPVNISDLVMKASEQLQSRMLDRVESVGWNALLGTFSVLGPGGSVLHSDTFAVQTHTAAVPWATFATATPLKDFRDVKLKGRGKGVNFGRGAVAYANMATVNNILSNLNNSDLFGKRNSDHSTLTGLDDVNRILLAADAPILAEYDGGYFNDAGTWTTFIPDNRVIVVGRRDSGSSIMDYVMVRNVNNPDMAPGQYTRVIDKGEDMIPRIIEVHNGHNGAPRIYQPGSVCVMTV